LAWLWGGIRGGKPESLLQAIGQVQKTAYPKMMKYETIFIMVRVAVHADHKQLSDIVHEIETQSKLVLTDTANVNILETEILLSRTRNVKNINHGTQHKL
jgi:hypothetical protein